MAKLKKQILSVGTHRSPEGELVVTPKRLRHWANQFKRFKSNKQVVPCGWDHGEGEGLLPLSTVEYEKKRSAKDNVGRLRSFRVLPGGKAAEIVVEVHDEKAKTDARANMVKISPVITDHWKDGAGNEYEDILTHVDFVNHPVDHGQSDFVEVGDNAVACSLCLNLDGVRSKSYTLAFPKKKGDDDDDEESSHDSPNFVDAEAGDDGDDESATESDDLDDFGDDENGEQLEGSSDTKQLAMDVMAKVGAEVPVDFDPMTPNGLTLLLTAMLNKLGGDSMADDALGTGDLAQTTPEFAAMSQAYQRDHRTGLKRRINEILRQGRATPAKCKQALESVGSVKLSLGDNGRLANSRVEDWIEHSESVPEGTYWDDQVRTKNLSLQTASPPEGIFGDAGESVDRGNEIADEIFGTQS